MVTVATTATQPDGMGEVGSVTLIVYHHAGVELVTLRVGQELTIGRSRPADLVLQERKLSRVHARFSFIAGQLWIEDVDSMNGTLVNGQRITRHMLKLDDRIAMPGVTALLHTHGPAPVPEQLMQEMEQARQIQQRLVGPVELVQRGALQLAGFYRPASVCGGDFWNLFDLGPDRTLVVIGDVTGHGLPAALLTATVKSCCDTLRSTHGVDLSLNTLMQTLNQVTFDVGQSQHLMTLFATMVDLDRRQLSFANAAHPLPYLCRDGQIHALAAHGNRLGDLQHWDFPRGRRALQDGDLVLWYSDGLTDQPGLDGRRWGEKALRQTLARHQGGSADTVRDAIVAALSAHAGDGPPEDDITFVVGKIAH